MDDFLKGNYEINQKKLKKTEKAEDAEDEFEKKALERLGGSIAFVKKSKTLLWKGDEK